MRRRGVSKAAKAEKREHTHSDRGRLLAEPEGDLLLGGVDGVGAVADVAVKCKLINITFFTSDKAILATLLLTVQRQWQSHHG